MNNWKDIINFTNGTVDFDNIKFCSFEFVKDLVHDPNLVESTFDIPAHITLPALINLNNRLVLMEEAMSKSVNVLDQIIRLLETRRVK